MCIATVVQRWLQASEASLEAAKLAMRAVLTGAEELKQVEFVEIWMFPKIGVGTPKCMVKIMEHPIKIDDLGVPLFLETPICCGERWWELQVTSFFLDIFA